MAMTLLTVEDLDTLPDRECGYELIEGELLEMPPADREQGETAWSLVMRVARTEGVENVVQGYIADTRFILARDPDVVVVPDAAFVRVDRLPPKGQRPRRLELAPDIAVEVVSPSDLAAHLMDKIVRYLRAGTRLVWVIYPRSRMVMVFYADHTARLLFENDELDGGEIIPGFRVRVGDLFE